LEKYLELSAKRRYHKVKKRGYVGSARILRRAVARIRPEGGRTHMKRPLPGSRRRFDS
jgi:hypothetical protein